MCELHEIFNLKILHNGKLLCSQLTLNGRKSWEGFTGTTKCSMRNNEHDKRNDSTELNSTIQTYHKINIY